MRVLFISGREPGYTRNRVILKGLRENNVEVIECTSSEISYLSRFSSVLWKWAKLALTGIDYDAIFVGYLGHPLVPLVRVFGRGKPVVFDAFLSLYDTLVFDRNKFSRGSHIGKFLHFLDRYSCSLADRVLLDTQRHIDFFCQEFGLGHDRFERVLVGADDSYFHPREPDSDNRFTVYFQGASGGMLLPLHGFPYILRAAKLLEEQRDIEFRMICRASSGVYGSLVQELDLENVEFITSVPYSTLPDIVASSSVCLGIFGSTEKASRVIPTKAYQALAMKKPLVTSATPAIGELLVDREEVFLCRPADPRSLAEAILTLKEDADLRERIALGGYRKFKKECTSRTIGSQLKGIIERLVT